MRVPPVIWSAAGFEQTSITGMADRPAPVTPAGRAIDHLGSPHSDDPPIHLLPADGEAGARRRRGAVAQADGPRGADPPARIGPVDVPARRLEGAREGRA